MNYVKEINAFYVRLETNPLSASAVALWHGLMHVNNRARWRECFTVAGAVLRMKTGLPESSFKRARLELREKGYILHRPRGSKAPEYEMVSMLQDAFIPVEQEEVAAACEAEELEEPLTLELFAECLKQGAEGNDKELQFSTYLFYEEHFGEPKGKVADELYGWARKLGDGLVNEALVRAIRSGKKVWSYVRGILRNWSKSQLHTVEEIERAEESFYEKRGWHFSGKGKERAEVIPEWFKGGVCSG